MLIIPLSKVCDRMIKDAQEGIPIDWSQLNIDLSNQPPVTTESRLVTSANPASEEHSKQEPGINLPSTAAPEPAVNETSPEQPLNVNNQEAEVPVPRTTLEALEQRLAKYQSTLLETQSTGNTSKQRRIGRIVKQYQDAVRSCKAGKPVPFDELPDPPGKRFEFDSKHISSDIFQLKRLSTDPRCSE